MKHMVLITVSMQALMHKMSWATAMTSSTMLLIVIQMPTGILIKNNI